MTADIHFLDFAVHKIHNLFRRPPENVVWKPTHTTNIFLFFNHRVNHYVFQLPTRLAIWIPIAAGVLVFGRPVKTAVRRWARVLAFMGALAGFLVTLPLFTGFDRLSGGYQFTEFHE